MDVVHAWLQRVVCAAPASSVVAVVVGWTPRRRGRQGEFHYTARAAVVWSLTERGYCGLKVRFASVKYQQQQNGQISIYLNEIHSHKRFRITLFVRTKHSVEFGVDLLSSYKTTFNN